MTTKSDIRERWEKFARANNLEFWNFFNIETKMDTCAKFGGACPCLPRWRKYCPGKECLEDIKKAGACYCCVFKEKNREICLNKHGEMTKEVRKNFGI